MRAALQALVLASLLGCGRPCPPSAVAPARSLGREASASPESRATQEPGTAARALQALLDQAWEHEMREHPTWASSIGDRRYNRSWDDTSLAAFERRHGHDQEVLAKLRAIPRAELPPEAQLDYDLFAQQHELAIEGHRFGLHLLPVNQRGGIQSADELADELRFETTQDYEDWVARLEAFPSQVDQIIALMREGVRRRIVHPRIVMARLPAQIDKQIVVDARASPFFSPFKRQDTRFAADRERLSPLARRHIEAGIVPAFRRFKAFFVGEYLPACLDGVGAWRLPEGEAMYAYLARLHTTTGLAPEQIHDIGLSEVARIRKEMIDIERRVGHQEPLPEFFRFLRTDPRFFKKTREELLATYEAMAKKIDPRLVKVFGKIPRMPYGVEAIPDATAPDTTTAYYREPAEDGSRAGTYFVNLHRPETRPTWEMMALSLHESVPGHHFQIALALERNDMPRFRRHAQYTAFVEGWGLYAASLGDEMGLYDDPFSKFVQLT